MKNEKEKYYCNICGKECEHDKENLLDLCDVCKQKIEIIKTEIMPSLTIKENGKWSLDLSERPEHFDSVLFGKTKYQTYCDSNDISPYKIKQGRCMAIPDLNTYEYYQWDGNFEALKNVSFIKEEIGNFEVGGSGYGNYHLDYYGDTIQDFYPGDYIVNKEAGDGSPICIFSKECFEDNFKYR